MITMKDIVREVAERHGLQPDDITGPSRVRSIAWPRQEAMWEARQRTKMSYPAIGRRLGGRDHATVIYGVREYEKRRVEKALARNTEHDDFGGREEFPA